VCWHNHGIVEDIKQHADHVHKQFSWIKDSYRGDWDAESKQFAEMDALLLSYRHPNTQHWIKFTRQGPPEQIRAWSAYVETAFLQQAGQLDRFTKALYNLATPISFAPYTHKPQQTDFNLICYLGVVHSFHNIGQAHALNKLLDDPTVDNVALAYAQIIYKRAQRGKPVNITPQGHA
jgi:hypothetical protein